MKKAKPEHKPKRRWRQFTLRAVLIAFVIAALPLYWLQGEIKLARQQRLAAEAILANGGRVTFTGSTFFVAQGDSARVQDLPSNWWTQLLGEDPQLRVEFACIGTIFNPGTSTPRIAGYGGPSLPHIARLRGIKILWAGGTSITDEGLHHIHGIKSLQELELKYSAVTDVSASTIASLTNLRYLDLSGTPCGDGTLEQLRHLEHLEHLVLDDTQITDAGLVHLSNLPRLERLSLAGTQIGDEGITAISNMPRIYSLDIRDTKVTDAGLTALIGMQSLQSLNTHSYEDSRTMYTDAGLSAFAQARLDVEVNTKVSARFKKPTRE